MVEEKKEKIVNMLRLAKKANAVALGRVAVKKDILKHRTKLIFSGKRSYPQAGGRKRAEICKQQGIQISYIFSDEDLSKIFNRQKLTLVAISNINFAKGIKNILNN